MGMRKIKCKGIPFNVIFSNAKQYKKRPIKIWAAQIEHAFTVKTMEGTMKGKPGDYCIAGIDGEMYLCDKTIFEKTYDEFKPWYHWLMFRRKQ